MKEVCTSCGSERTAPTLDLRIALRQSRGNPYWVRCLECGAHYVKTGKENWANHTHPHVLPRAADSDQEGAAVPLGEFDDVDKIPRSVPDVETVLDRAGELRDAGYNFEVVKPGDEETEEESVNRFDCPQCGDVVEGYPDECPHCETGYTWN